MNLVERKTYTKQMPSLPRSPGAQQRGWLIGPNSYSHGRVYTIQPGVRSVEDGTMRSGNVNALGLAGAGLEDEALVADEEVGLEYFVTIVFLDQVHEVGQLVCSL